ncbi:MAG: 50S ribosomal protein L21e [Candidatus Micrarchaeota archaeon]|nr:50S ribosomal protein L21e [Candidatus Micrarchaeota archaeon]MDE1847504.1 50S ribosomal protein L21e [Candidatus Micrarchaeota archaeon]MDE1863860.1 50S ribosomal protein L21e [Candidatus Micrarchaeota archaeon]
MAPRSHGLFIGRTRHLARHHKPSKLGLTTLIKNFSVGDKVAIVPKGSFRDIPHPRYRGRIGEIIEKRGDAYVVEVSVSKSTIRKIIVPQRHLEKP